MLTPEGLLDDTTDPIMLLALWTKTLKKERGLSSEKPFISAGMGKPTYPANLHTIQMMIRYWHGIEASILKMQSTEECTAEHLALDYGDARGDAEPRDMMARAMTLWYEHPINKDNILFTVGGAGALRIIFETCNQEYKNIPNYRVITPFPYYTLFKDNKHILHPIDVMSNKHYQLTATALEESILSAYEASKKDKHLPKVFLFSNPSNPLGTVISKSELTKIAKVLSKYPDLQIIIDEAYAEMYWDGDKVPSLLDVAPELKNRITILRSATKALSCAGERMAMLITFNQERMNRYVSTSISTYGHPPRSSQIAYAYTMAHFDESQNLALKKYYKPKVTYINQRARELGISMPNPSYRVQATFYVLCDLSDLLGEPIPEAAQRALGRKSIITTDEELAYYLLFQEHLMLAPGSYFGMNPNKGFVRITCSDSPTELEEMMNRLERVILSARKKKALQLITSIETKIELIPIYLKQHKEALNIELINITKGKKGCLELQNQNRMLAQLFTKIKSSIPRVSMLYYFPTLFAYAPQLPLQKNRDDEWKQCVTHHVTEGPLKNHLLSLSEEEKKTFIPWKNHLKSQETIFKKLRFEDDSTDDEQKHMNPGGWI